MSLLVPRTELHSAKVPGRRSDAVPLPRQSNHQSGLRQITSKSQYKNCIPLTVQIDLKPQKDSKVKVVLHEAFGINAGISLCPSQGGACEKLSSQVGSTEILYADVRAGKQYELRIDYTDSVVNMHLFSQCPHVVLELSMIATKDLANLNLLLDDSLSQEDSNNKVRLMFDYVTQTDMPLLIDDPANNTFSYESDTTQEWEVVQR